MAWKRVPVQMDADMVAALDAQAQRDGVSRSELLRRGVQKVLDEATEIAELERQHAEGYRRFPQGEEDFPVPPDSCPAR